MARDKKVTALRVMLNREVMAVQVYRWQIWRFRGRKDIAEKMRLAIDNEREHVVGLRSRLVALESSPSSLGLLFYVFGASAMGFVPAALGKRIALKSDIWVEKLAVKHYTRCLDDKVLDDESRTMIEKYREDEERHIETWRDSLNILNGNPA